MIAALESYLAGINHELAVFLISMIPIVELRGAIPFGITLGVEEVLVYVLAVIGNMLPIPFIIWFFRPIINYMEKTKLFGNTPSVIFDFDENKVYETSHKLEYKLKDILSGKLELIFNDINE